MSKIPITILTGFLGSGKTTLLSEILDFHQHKAIAVIVNELGEVGLDHSILQQSISFVQEKMLLLSGGCICCHYREDLISQLRNLLIDSQTHQKPLEHIIIETTGLANPSPILFSILRDPFLSQHFVPQKMITCLDSVNGFLHLEKNLEAKNQIIASDIAIITKTDLKDNFQELKEMITAINPTLEVHNKSELDYNLILNNPHISPAEKKLSPTPPTHQSHIKTLCVEFSTPLNWSFFGVWLSLLLYRYGDKILRTKGILQTSESQLVAINGVQHIIHPPTHLKQADNITKSQLVFILKDLDTQDILDSLQFLTDQLSISTF